MSKQALDRILQSQGFGTRKWCRELITEGEIKIAGETIPDNNAQFEINGLEFTVYDEPHLYRKLLYIALNKPADRLNITPGKLLR